jgi:hypothetical protein
MTRNTLIMENPAVQGGAPKQDDIAGNNIVFDTTASLHRLQAAQLARRFGMTLRMASIVAPFFFGETQQ